MVEIEAQAAKRRHGRVSRIYIDTSVVGGCLDEEFAAASRALLDMAEAGGIIPLVSDLLLEELGRAPRPVQVLLDALPARSTEFVAASEETVRLRDCYLAAQVVGAAFRNDAHHVAIATVSRADLIVSWNFKHIVRVQRIRAFNSVNLAEGYSMIDIRSPWEVV